MNKRLGLLFITALISLGNIAKAQIVGTNCFVQGQYLEAGMQRNGSMGAPSAPSTYHPHSSASMCSSSSRVLASVYDWGLDGWTTGSPNYMGDYTLPGSPWEEWDIEVNGTKGTGNSNTCSFTGAGGLTGGFTTWTSVGGRQLGNWSGTFMSGGLAVTKEHRIDTFGGALVITVKFVNNTSSAMSDVYYMRTCDPDNNQSWSGGSFTTINRIEYQNDYYHRVMVVARSTGSASATGTPATELALGTKDCRAKAVIFSSWPLGSGCRLSNIWAASASCLGSSYYSAGTQVSGDIAIGLVYKIGTIAPNDSAFISYAYIYNYRSGIDSAFPEPKLDVGGTLIDSVDSVVICSPENLNIIYGSDKSWTNGEWTWAPAVGLATTTGISNVVTPSALSGTTTYTITGTNPMMGSCVTKTFLLTVTPVPIAPPSTRDTFFCRDLTSPPSLAVLVTATGSLLWYTSATGGTGSTVAPTVSTSTVGTTTYYVSQVNSAGCESARIPIVVTIIPPPVVTLTNNGPLCPGSALVIALYDTLTTTSITYSWSGPGGYTATTSGVLKNPCVYADSGVYTVSLVFDGGCTTDPTSTTVIVHSTPGSPTFTNPTYCQYVTASPLSATGSNILWYTTAIGGTGSITAPTPSTASPGVFTFYVTQSIYGCESARYPVVVTVNPKPSPPVITGAPAEYCPNEPFGTFSIGAGTGTVLWYTGMTGGTGSYAPPVMSTTTPGTYYTYASQTVLGCESDRTPIPIIIDDSVKAHFYYTKHLGCTEDTIVFSNYSYGAINYRWDFGDGTSSSATHPVHIYPTQGVYTVKMFARSLHCVDSTITTIDTRHPLAAAFNIAPTIVCQGSPVAFTDVSTATSPTFMWSFGDGTSSTAVNPNHIYTYTGTYTIRQIVKDLVPCYDTAYGTVVVDSLSPISVTLSDTVLCLGSYITLSADFSNLGHTRLTWDFGNGDSTLNVNPTVYAYSAPGTYNITTTSYYRVCPPAVTHRTVNVFGVPHIDLGPDTTICAGSASFTLSDYINAGNPSAHWLWNTGQTTSSIAVTTAGAYSATVTIGGCSATDSVLVTNDCHVVLPNCFSPNRDGVNDYFNPRDYFEKGVQSFSLTIYNRWGQVIFETNSTYGRGWDGRYNGVEQPEGVYVYTVRAVFVDGQSINKTGNLTLIK